MHEKFNNPKEYKHLLSEMEMEYGPSGDLIIKLGEDESRYWEYEDFNLVIKFNRVGNAGIVKIGLNNLSIVEVD